MWFIRPHSFIHIGIVQWDSFWNDGLQYAHNEIDWHERYIKLEELWTFWNWKSWYVTLTTMKWMDFGLVLWWILKKFKNLILILKCNNEIKIERFWFIFNEAYELSTFIWWKTNTFFSKVHYIWKKIKIMLKFNKNVLINEL
jgi:hypothetical protein